MKSLRTLCEKCAGDYREAGFLTHLDGYQEIKHSCDLCGRPGFEYTVSERKGEKRGAGS